MPNTQRILPPTVRRVARQHIEACQLGSQIVSPQVRYARAYGTNEKYLFLWFRVTEDKRYFETDYKHKHGMREDTILPPGSVKHLSRQYTWSRDSRDSKLCVVSNHIPHDITDEELDRVVEERVAEFDGNDITLNSSRTFISVYLT